MNAPKSLKIIDLIHIVETAAQNYRNKALNSLRHNTCECSNEILTEENQDLIDAVLADFVNFLAAEYGVNYGTKSYDIYWPEALKEWKRIEEISKTDLVTFEKEKQIWETTKQLKRENKDVLQ
jgi:hypothetical protein